MVYSRLPIWTKIYDGDESKSNGRYQPVDNECKICRGQERDCPDGATEKTEEGENPWVY